MKYQWHKITLVNNTQVQNLITLLRKLKPTVGAFDTETTGLHIINDKPFLFQFGFLVPDKPEGYTFAVDIERQPEFAKNVIKIWHSYAKHLKILYSICTRCVTSGRRRTSAWLERICF